MKFLLLVILIFSLVSFASSKSDDLLFKKNNLDKFKPSDNPFGSDLWRRMKDIAIKYKDQDIYQNAIRQIEDADGAGAANLSNDLFDQLSAKD